MFTGRQGIYVGVYADLMIDNWENSWMWRKLWKRRGGSYLLTDLACASFRVRPGNEEIQDGARDFL